MDKGVRRKLQSDIVAAANAKDAPTAFKLFEGFKEYVKEIKPTILSSLFRSLAKKEDERYLNELMTYIQTNDLQMTESEYKSTCIGAIARRYCGLLLLNS